MDGNRKLNSIVLYIAFFGLSSGIATSPEAAEDSPPPIQLSTFDMARMHLEKVDLEALRLAVQDLAATFPNEYRQSGEFLAQADAYEKRLPQIREALERGESAALREADEIVRFQRTALLANPLLDFERLLLIKRKPLGDPRRAQDMDRGIGKYIGLPQQSSWQIQTMPNTSEWENEICTLSPVGPEGKLSTLYRPPAQELISEMDLHFDADRLMFCMPDNRGLWQLFEVGTDGKNVRQVSLGDQPDVHNFDACYLPNGQIAFISTAAFQGVPCNASVNVGMMYTMDADGTNVRQICFEQDHNFCPTVLNDGRVLYLRWEYTDIPHVWARFLFTMNPDGTGQREYYGSGSYWPNAVFYARPIPDHPTKIVGIVTGHHVGRIGELVVFDPALGRQSNAGVVQRIPDRNESVQPLIQDKLTIESWPKFVHPYPLSEKYFLVSAKPSAHDLWGIYLVDVFNNTVLIKEVEDSALLEPLPLRKTKTPPAIPSRVHPDREDAVVYLEDIYKGPGLAGVPRGTVKNLRLYTYHFAYRTIAGINHRVGADGPWEPKRILGTVPVEEDGSAFFRVPANTPISIQPLDSQGRALQLMRSWTTAMPGEFVSCVGCHEKQNSAPPNFQTVAGKKEPSEIQPWRGPARGLSFNRDVQPVLDRHCVGCHDGGEMDDGKALPDLRRDSGKFVVYKNGVPEAKIITGVPREELVKEYGGVFDPAYIALRRYVRVGGLESDLRQLNPGEFHANTTELVQMLAKGHHGVQLDEEAWDRLATWIDLNAPCHGTWQEVVGKEKLVNDHRRRTELRTLYGGPLEDPEILPDMPSHAVQPILPVAPSQRTVETIVYEGWPFDTKRAQRLQAETGTAKRSVNLGRGVKLELALIPAGGFVMGESSGHADEQPTAAIEIEKPFWIGQFEVTNSQFALFDPSHDSRYEHKGSWMFNEWDLGWNLNEPEQPVVRVTQREAVEFCKWLSKKTGLKVTLPTEAQWEYACRAGSRKAFSYGGRETDFSAHANMADRTIRDLAYDVRDQYPPDLVPRNTASNDTSLVSAQVGSYQANAWGVHDMHGNVWEWTRSSYEAYPYRESDGRNDHSEAGSKVVRGGSWYDRPERCRSAYRLQYPVWQKVYNVGFRVAVEWEDNRKLTTREP